MRKLKENAIKARLISPRLKMVIEKGKNKIVIEGDYFSVRQILYSGQVFRFKGFEKGYILISGKELAYLRQDKNKTVIECTDADYFYDYFDLRTDYEKIAKELEKDCLLRPAAEYGRGIRILKQEKLETVISFIISANNNIKRIQGIIDRICSALGEEKEFNGIKYSAFPAAQKLAAAGKDFYKEIGAGYRAPYIDKTANEIFLGFDLEKISGLPLEQAEKELMSLYGIGKKVAGCILLFGYGRQDVFPVDTWIEKVYCQNYSPDKPVKVCREKIAEYFTDRYKGLSGYAQQYLFYYKRETDK